MELRNKYYKGRMVTEKKFNELIAASDECPGICETCVFYFDNFCLKFDSTTDDIELENNISVGIYGGKYRKAGNAEWYSYDLQTKYKIPDEHRSVWAEALRYLTPLEIKNALKFALGKRRVSDYKRDQKNK